MKRSVHNNLADEGKYDMVDGIRSGLDREYPDWKNPNGTHMVPASFLSHQNNKGSIAEKVIYDLLHDCGIKRKEPMFVVHSFVFSEHIPDSGRQKSWVMGETDFVIIHKNRGPILIEVKATDTGKSYQEAEQQLQKDKLALQMRFEKAVGDEFSRTKVNALFTNLPAFVAMPNCPRPTELAAHGNVLYKEDCSSINEFDTWWNEHVAKATPSGVSEEIYQHLVIR